MPRNTDARTARRRDAVRGACTATLLRLFVAALLWRLRRGLETSGFHAGALLILMLLNLGTIIPVWISLKTRLREIEGGEEDAAAQY